MDMLLMVLGVALIVVLLYLALTGSPIPPALKVVVLVGVALILLLCLAHQAGCQPPFENARPQAAVPS